MTYIVIDDDERATLEIFPGKPTVRGIEHEHLRGMGWNRVYLPPNTSAVGWVSDVGHSMPEFRRNIVASCLMVVMGSALWPLAGPLVVTGYDYDDREGGWPLTLPDPTREVLIGTYLAILKALAMPSPEELERYREVEFETDDFVEGVRLVAEQIEQAATPTLTRITPSGPRR